MNLIASSPDLGLSGANVLLAQVLQGMAAQGHGARWVVTSHEGRADAGWLIDSGLQFEVLAATPVGAVKQRQEMLAETIRSAAPCCYFPNYDFDMLWAVGAFPANCRTVFIMHCDDPVYYEAVRQRGSVMDAIVCVSRYLADEVSRRWPHLAGRIHHIPFGVEVPAKGPVRNPILGEGLLEVAFCGRLAEEQKRIGDLAEIILACQRRNLPVRFHIAGSGPDEDAFFARLQAPIAQGRVLRLGKLPHDRVAALLARCHVFILTSAYEGLPVSLLEAMAHGCVPVVSAVKSGIPEIIDDGANGFMLPIGDTEGFAARLKQLSGDAASLSGCAKSARAGIEARGYTLAASLERYQRLCSDLMDREPAARHAGGPLTPPRYRWHRRIRSRLGW